MAESSERRSVSSRDAKVRSAPDGGWGWCVVLGSFLVHVISDGISYTMGLMLMEVRAYFGSSHQTMGLLASLVWTVPYGTCEWHS